MRLRYVLVRGAFLFLARPMFALELRGVEHVPSSGAAILVASHRSWLDPALVGAVCRRPVRFLILDRVYAWRAGRWFFRFMRTIPVGSSPGQALPAIRAALERLRAGEVIGIFPEGRVFPEERPGAWRQGVALLALKSGAPLVPVAIRGSGLAWPHGRRLPRRAPVQVDVGPPFTVQADDSGRGGVERAAERIRAVLSELERDR
jgi:1-acyl-sn-glycerol-3-phosphate acyltransferase